MKYLSLLIIYSVVFTGCGTAWVVERNQNSGIIGYKGYSSSESATKAITSLIHCKSYNFVSDKLIDGGTTTTYIPVQSTNNLNGSGYTNSGAFYYSGQQTQTNYVPQQVKNFWRAFTYTCNEQEREPASASISISTVNNVQSCEEYCKFSAARGELAQGMTEDSCIKRLCGK